jgi:hypothetical protein
VVGTAAVGRDASGCVGVAKGESVWACEHMGVFRRNMVVSGMSAQHTRSESIHHTVIPKLNQHGYGGLIPSDWCQSKNIITRDSRCASGGGSGVGGGGGEVCVCV